MEKLLSKCFQRQFVGKILEKYQELQTWPRCMSKMEFELVKQAFAAGGKHWLNFIMANGFHVDEDTLKLLFISHDGTVKYQEYSDLLSNSHLNLFLLCRFRTRIFLTEAFLTSEFPSSNETDAYLDDVYLTLEEDLACFEYWSSIRGAEDIDVSKPEIQAKRAKKYSLREFENVPGLGNIKYLLWALEKHAMKSNNIGSIHRLKSLFKEIRPKVAAASKWANDDRVGQAELYEACEKVLDELKAYKEHSFPFLQKVNKRDAPDYYDVIKNPMDFGTMSKKLKSLQYASKSEFITDLQLIWDNCFYYNSDPSSVFRVHAMKMKDRADTLMKLVPDIVVRNREDVESESYESDDNHHPDSPSVGDEKMEDLQTNHYEPPLSPGSPTPIAMLRNDTQEEVMDVSEVLSTEHDNLEILSIEKAFENLCTVPSSLDDESISMRKIIQLPETQALPLNQYAVNLLLETWEIRAELLQNRISTLNGLRSKTGDAEALLRSPEDMSHYHHTLQLYKKRRSGSLQDHGKFVRHSNNEDLYFWPEYFSFLGCFPDLKAQSEYETSMFEPIADISQTGLSLDCFYDCLPSEKGLKRYRANIECFRECKRLERKLFEFSQQGFDSPVLEPTDEDPDEEIKLNFPQHNDIVKTNIKPYLNERCAQDLLKRSLSVVLIQSGFDSGSRTAMDTLVDVTSIYLLNIGKVFRHYLDFYCNELEPEELILHTLYEVGIHDLSVIEYSIKTEPERNLRKLDRIKKRLQEYYDVIMGVDEPKDDGDEMDIELDHDPAFMMGDFGEELGDDYLGLKSMGLTISSIPEKLWNTEGKKSNIRAKKRKEALLRGLSSVMNVGGFQGEEEEEYEAPPPFPQLKEIEGIIGLARPFFEKKLAETTSGFLLEDEFNPMKQKPKKKKKSNTKKTDGFQSRKAKPKVDR